MDINTDSLVFVPRDAGFFSVFNFLIGSINTGKHIYPYFNKDVFLKINQLNQHFAYWTESKNCWFDYFEPIKYYDNDTIHNTDNEFRDYKITVGEIASKEFRDPQTTYALMKNKFFFDLWRQKINIIFNKYIKFKPEIIQSSNHYFTNHLLNTENIAIHYRHPVHSCESGRIYFQQYFDIIDSLNYDNIFLSTDSELAILVFRDRYKEKIKYIPSIFRLSVDNILEWSYNLIHHKKINPVGIVDGKGYELHQHIIDNKIDSKKTTTDLLTEVICMSQCKYLVHQISNIPLAISYMNPHIEMLLVEGKK